MKDTILQHNNIMQISSEVALEIKIILFKYRPPQPK